MIVAARCVTSEGKSRDNEEDDTTVMAPVLLGFLLSIDWCSVLYKDFLRVLHYFPKFTGYSLRPGYKVLEFSLGV